MQTGSSVKITFWIYPPDCDFKGAEEFRRELAENYISAVQTRPGEAGGNFQLAVEFISRIKLVDVAAWLISGMTYDTVKAGAETFMLRPFMTAYKKLRDSNQEHHIDIEQLRIIFQDTTLIVDQIGKDGIFNQLEPIFRAISTHSPNLTLGSGERPFEIYIPVFKDPMRDPPCRYRAILDMDETIKNISPSSYFSLWGLYYDFARAFRIYDLNQHLLIDNEFFKRERYWKEMETRWARTRR